MQMHGAPPLGAPRKQKISMLPFITFALPAFKSRIRVVRAPIFTSVLDPGWGKRFSLLQTLPHRLGAHPASYSMGTGVLSRGQSSWGMKRTSLPHHVKIVQSYTSELYLYSPYMPQCEEGKNFSSTLVLTFVLSFMKIHQMFRPFETGGKQTARCSHRPNFSVKNAR